MAESQVAKMTLYHHFPSKEHLVLAFLEERRRRWVCGLSKTVDQMGSTPRDRLLALFDALDEWFHRPDYEGSSFTRTLYEISTNPVREAAIHEIELVRVLLRKHAADAGVRDPEHMSYQLQILVLGAMDASLGGNLDAARRARELAALLLDHAD